MKFYSKIIENSFNKKIISFLKKRKKLFKVKIIATPKEAQIKMNGKIQNFVVGENSATIKYEVSLDGYQTQSGSISINNNDVTENINLGEVL